MMELKLSIPKHKYFSIIILFVLAIVAAIALSSQLYQHPLTWEQIAMSGGETTVSNRTSHGLQQPASNLSARELKLHLAGDRAFEATFVTAPAPVNAGLGPLFNNSSCRACHINDGRGMPVKGNMLVRVSLPLEHLVVENLPVKQQASASVSLGNAPPVPGLGTQIQDGAIYGYKPKANVELEWVSKIATYGDNTAYNLRSPILKIHLPDGQPLPANILTSPRVPPPVFGRGLLEAIPESTILKLADPEDKDSDGISGRANQVWDVRKKQLVLGRFGLKANNPNLLQQNAAAYVNDMGVTNPLFPEQDGTSDINLETLKAATFYTQTIAVPARTLGDDPMVQRGEKLFVSANCAVCHVQELRTGDYEIKALANQTIHPYTDMLVHDMGEGLADGRPDFAASGVEWRTPPLWGLGLTQTVLPYSGYLHDGRAQSLAEAILWHGGEAEQSKEFFRNLPQGDRAAMLRFLNSL
jgi:CxxC motif-containing protein (DUF1111 family)